MDLARALAIILVIFGHETTYPREIIRGMIYSFHMPLFFILSGIVFGTYNNKKETFRWFVKKKIKAILLPALFFEIVMYCWNVLKMLIESGVSKELLFKRFLGIFIQIQYSDYTGALWFLPCMFLCQIVFYFLFKINKSWIRFLLVLVLYIGAYIWGNAQLPFLPWAIDVVPVGVLYMFVGFCIRSTVKKYNEIGNNLKSVVIIILMLLYFFTYYISNIKFGNGYALDVREYGNIVLNTICAISASIAIILMCSLCKKKIDWLGYIGQNSMSYYGLQGVMVGALNTVIWKVIPSMTSGIEGILISCVSLIISLCVDSIGVEFYKNKVAVIWRRL